MTTQIINGMTRDELRNAEFTNQQIFEMLAEEESTAFYMWSDCAGSPEQKELLKKIHQAKRQILVDFAKATGCHN